MNKLTKLLHRMRFIPLILIVFLTVMMVVPATLMADQPTVNLGTTSNFAVLAGTTITNEGDSVINGDIGVWPGLAITGFPPGIVNGATHAGDAVAQQAQSDLTTAYNDAAGRTPVTTIATELGGQTLTPGVYDSASGTFEITGTLTLDAEGDPNRVFIFQMETTLITASGSNINLINGARFCRIFWQVGSSATLGTSSNFIGHIFALTSISAGNGATVQGQLLARNGAVTLNTNTITNGTCSTIVPDTTEDGVVVADTPPEEVTVDEATITASSGSGGTISNEGSTTVAGGDSITYTFTPQSEDYEISDVIVDGVSVGAVRSITFVNVQANHTIYVDFGIIARPATEPATQPAAEPAAQPTAEELPYTGYSMMFYIMGFGALILAIGLILVLRKTNNYIAKHLKI